MIEIQLEYGGPWIPLLRVRGGVDFGIAEGQRILQAGLFGIRVLFPNDGGVSFVVARVSPTSKQFMWRSASMAAPAFADLW